jgi:hypothetical protein
MFQVTPAQPYHFPQMRSTGNATYMLVRQFQFPDEFQEHEPLISRDSHRCLKVDPERTLDCFRRHTGYPMDELDIWARATSDEDVLAFIKDLLKDQLVEMDAKIQWTGYRILGTVNNGYTIWTLQLFAKDPASDTTVYSGMDAPNIIGSLPLPASK